MLNLAGVYNTLRGNVLCQHGNNDFFNDDNPGTDMMGIIFRITFQIVWHYKERAACELDCASYVGLLKLFMF